jgi:hypothetical protein
MSESAEQQLASQFRRLIELRVAYDETKVAHDTAKAEYREYEKELYEQMEHGPLKGSRKIDLGGEFGTVTFTPRATPYGRIINRDEAVAYFEERGELDTMIQDEVIARRLNELVKERLETGETLPPGVDFYYRRGVTITRK